MDKTMILHKIKQTIQLLKWGKWDMRNRSKKGLKAEREWHFSLHSGLACFDQVTSVT